MNVICSISKKMICIHFPPLICVNHIWLKAVKRQPANKSIKTISKISGNKVNVICWLVEYAFIRNNQANEYNEVSCFYLSLRIPQSSFQHMSESVFVFMLKIVTSLVTHRVNALIIRLNIHLLKGLFNDTVLFKHVSVTVNNLI